MYLLKLIICLFIPYSGCINDMDLVRKFDYCNKAKCLIGKHSACDCKRRPPREEITTDPDVYEYRKLILDNHNEVRNFVACGNETRPPPKGLPTASDMLLLHYDLELEFIARCFALSKYKHDGKHSPHDECRTMMSNIQAGQNIMMQSDLATFTRQSPKIRDHWYDEVKYLDNDSVVDRIEEDDHYRGQIGHFLQVMKSTVNLIGCVRVEKKDNQFGGRYTLICNYGSTFLHGGGIITHARLYSRGEPCSHCPKGMTCASTRYPCLCGADQPIPEDLTGIGSGETVQSSVLMVVSIIYILLNPFGF